MLSRVQGGRLRPSDRYHAQYVQTYSNMEWVNGVIESGPSQEQPPSRLSMTMNVSQGMQCTGTLASSEFSIFSAGEQHPSIIAFELLNDDDSIEFIPAQDGWKAVAMQLFCE